MGGWALTHALHHANSDTPEDPHNRNAGFWYCHFGWIFSSKKYKITQRDYMKVTTGLGRIVHFHDRVYLLWDPLWSLAFPALVASLWGEAWNGLFVAGAARWSFVQHVTFFVNSMAHGERDESAVWRTVEPTSVGMGPRVSFVTTLFALGEGWHDYHHLFPWDYAAAELDAWDQWNPTKVFIGICSAAGLVFGRRRCSSRLQEARRRELLQQSGVSSVNSAEASESTWAYAVRGPKFLRSRVMVPAHSDVPRRSCAVS